MDNLNLDDFGGASVYRWTHQHMVEVLTKGSNPIVKNIYAKNAIKSILREDFVPEQFKAEAYEDKDIDLGFGEKMDKPTVIAQMLELMKPKLGGTYLDIGTGSGWMAALIAFASGATGIVYSIERIQFMAEAARTNLQKYPNISNVEVIFRDGAAGLPEKAPYDAIHASAAYDEIPAVLTNQLKIGGRLVAPTLEDDVRVVERVSENEFKETVHKGFYFKALEEGVV
ncbi:protein-L-isoaspartate O-methyltransferase [Candidatus Dojkabacteria bacterium]|uniref:Protein-L-isoaspartate O-methyltransferase n=1 Tax=Candidatus Dojkabacteria bacterium TaxID=2099670 RepID=A0A955L793_9BACT|nr:protein-L-isoaspartate O-methyltransferase [Candidatus Dojkabacteria bacterium]